MAEEVKTPAAKSGNAKGKKPPQQTGAPTAYDIVQRSRDKTRPTSLTYIEKLTETFIELHGDRYYADDKAIVGGIATIGGKPVTIIGIEKGSDTAGKVLRNFGSASPEGYRKALRLMRQAEKFHRPVLCLVDTSGAACGIGAEERGQAEAIADNLVRMMGLKTPILSIVIGEGGSGGALGLAVADEVWVTETSTYSVISPEGCASILWKDAAKVREASEALKMTAPDLLRSKAADRVIQEDNFSDDYFARLKEEIAAFFARQTQKSAEELLQARYNRFRAF